MMSTSPRMVSKVTVPVEPRRSFAVVALVRERFHCELRNTTVSNEDAPYTKADSSCQHEGR
jgi:hypothetical protein